MIERIPSDSGNNSYSDLTRVVPSPVLFTVYNRCLSSYAVSLSVLGIWEKILELVNGRHTIYGILAKKKYCSAYRALICTVAATTERFCTLYSWDVFTKLPAHIPISTMCSAHVGDPD